MSATALAGKAPATCCGLACLFGSKVCHTATEFATQTGVGCGTVKPTSGWSGSPPGRPPTALSYAAAGADFELVAPERTYLRSSKPVVAVCAVSCPCRQLQGSSGSRTHPAVRLQPATGSSLPALALLLRRATAPWAKARPHKLQPAAGAACPPTGYSCLVPLPAHPPGAHRMRQVPGLALHHQRAAEAGPQVRAGAASHAVR